jgi:diadenylate cyclase
MTFLGWLKLVLEVLLAAALIHTFIRFLRDTRGSGVMRGFMLAVLLLGTLFFVVVDLLGLEHLAWVADQGLPLLLITLVVVFQPEIRQVLVRLGENRLLRRVGGTAASDTAAATEIVQAVERLSRRGFGGLIVVERNIGIGGFTEGATLVDAQLSAALLVTLFFKDAPLHDGAVLVRGSRIVAAGALLPLSENPNLPPRLGTRHRAAVGATEENDAIAIVVSEETRRITVVRRGRIEEGVSAERLLAVLRGDEATEGESA